MIFPDNANIVNNTPKDKFENTAEVAFVAYEGFDEEKNDSKHVCDLFNNDGEEGGYWLHDSCSVAVYICRRCFNYIAKGNQA